MPDDTLDELDKIAEQNDCHGELERNTRVPRNRYGTGFGRFKPERVPKWKSQLTALKVQQRKREQRDEEKR